MGDWEAIKGFWTEDWWSDFEFNKNSLAVMLKIELSGVKTEAGRLVSKLLKLAKDGGGFKQGSRSGDYKIWSDSEYRADRICQWVECGVKVKSRVTPWFLVWTTGRTELPSTETGKNGRNMFREEYQDFGFGMFIGIQVEISGRQWDI